MLYPWSQGILPAISWENVCSLIYRNILSSILSTTFYIYFHWYTVEGNLSLLFFNNVGFGFSRLLILIIPQGVLKSQNKYVLNKHHQMLQSEFLWMRIQIYVYITRRCKIFLKLIFPNPCGICDGYFAVYGHVHL